MVEIEWLSFDGCPHVDAARELLKACVEELHVSARIEEKVGVYPSPTIRVDGEDVMGSPPFAEAACRLETLKDCPGTNPFVGLEKLKTCKLS